MNIPNFLCFSFCIGNFSILLLTSVKLEDKISTGSSFPKNVLIGCLSL